MIVLGIDPGYDRCGLALISKSAQGSELIDSFCLVTNKKDTFSQRLLSIGNQLEKIIKDNKPDELAMEKLFFSVNQKTALQVAEVRGLISYLGAKHRLPLYEYGPGEIKLTITGYGKANKNQIALMLPRLIKIKKDISLDDEFDAIAIALAHLAIKR